MSEFRMPSLGADMEAGTLVEWHKKPGDIVERGDIVAVVETQKGAIEIEVFQSGVLERLLVAPGQKVPVGTVLAIIRGPEEGPAEATKPAIPIAMEAQPPLPKLGDGARTESIESPARPIDSIRARVSPAARRRAQELGVDLAAVAGTGADGAVTLADVENAARPPIPAAPAERNSGRAPPAMRSAIAAAMARSKREIPHFYLDTAIDLTVALDWLLAENSARPVTSRLLLAPLLLKATALALREMPDFNGYWEADRFRPGTGIHVGWAVSLRPGGLIAPALHDVDTLSLETLMSKLRDLVKRAKSGGLRSSELADATVTISSLGDRGADALYGIIYPPQVALIGFGTPGERPWVVERQVLPRKIMRATLAADHRAADGHRGGLFLNAIHQLLQRPERL